jgi:hypothetical protein
MALGMQGFSRPLESRARQSAVQGRHFMKYLWIACVLLLGAPASAETRFCFVGECTFPGRVFKISLDGKVTGITGASGRNLKQFSGAHAIACPTENEIYIAETSNWRVQKIVLR